MNAPEGFESQVIDANIVEDVIALLVNSVAGPREAMGVITVVIKTLNREPFREQEPPPSNEELCAELLVQLNSIQRVGLQ